MPEKFWEFINQAGSNSAELLLYGDIAGEKSWFGDEMTPKQFASDMNKLGDVDEIIVRINSGGGDVFAAQAIGDALEAHKAIMTARIGGLCGSAATIIACHCDKVVAANDSTYMIHPVKLRIPGAVDAAGLQNCIEAINTIKENIVNLYVKKTGRSKEEITGWMDATSWWTAAEAKENGFVDELVDDEKDTVVENRSGVLFVNSISMNLPFDKAPTFVQNSLAAAPAANSSVNIQPAVEPKNKTQEVQEMDIKSLEDLRQHFPAFVDQIEQVAAQRAVQEERQRIQDIEEMALPGSEEITAKAKFLEPMSAADYAKAMVKNAKTQGAAFLQQMQQEAEEGGANGVGSAPAPGDKDSMTEAIAQAKKDAAVFMNSAKKNGGR